MSSVLSFSPPVAGRTVDAVFINTDQPFAMRSARQGIFFGNGGLACTGIYKLAQRVLLRFLTPIGRQPYAPNSGTQFINELTMHHLRTVPDVRRVFAHSRDALLSQFAADAIMRSNTPADELLQDVELVNIQIQNRELTLRLRITSAAGTSLQFTAPIALN